MYAANEKTTTITPAEILSKCRKLKAQHGLDMVIIDYLQLMKAEKARNELTKLAQDVDIFIKPVADENKNIRNESSLAGSRSIINKADVGAIMARPSKEELDILKSDIERLNITPNIVTDIYKVRSGEWNQVRIWSRMDLGTMRKEDLFITDSDNNLMDFEPYELVASLEEDSSTLTNQEVLVRLRKEEF
mgnify:CR=1 FL=1